MTKFPIPDFRGCMRGIPAFSTGRLSARLAIPATMLGALAIFVVGLVHLGFSPARMLAGFSSSAGSR